MITRISTRDTRYPIGSGHGSDAIHKDPVYSYAVTLLHDDKGRTGSGLAFTLGEGNYSERDIKEAARAFTGWSLDMEDNAAFRFRPGMHDDGVKTVLGRTGNLDGDAEIGTRTMKLALRRLRRWAGLALLLEGFRRRSAVPQAFVSGLVSVSSSSLASRVSSWSRPSTFRRPA